MLIIVSITASLCMLILGILIGYALKAKYSKTIMKKFDSLMSKNPLSKPPAHPPSSSAGITLNDTSSSSSTRKFNPYQFAANTKTTNIDGSSLLYGSMGNKTSSSSSSSAASSSSKSSDCCSRQNSNASVDGIKTASSQHLKLMKSKNVIGRDFFTVQNDYGLLPPSSSCALNNQSSSSQRHYLKPPPPIAPPQLPHTLQQHRLSSTSSSSTTDSSYCGVAYNLMNSQSCLLNGVLAAAAAAAVPPASKQSNINSSSEVIIVGNCSTGFFSSFFSNKFDLTTPCPS